jgi:predicted DNA-binding transcriptional regulator YafY
MSRPKSKSTLRRITGDEVRAACRSYKSTRQLADEIGTSTRTIERRLDDLRAAGYTVAIKMAWDGQHKRSPHYKISGRAAKG